MNIKEFKNEFRLICTDTWGSALDAWFECAGRMYKRNMPIPNSWEYRPGLSPTDKDSYWFSLFAKCKNKELNELGGYLFRYCQFLKYKEVDY